MSRRPDFFLVGAPKSGTTSLWRYLEQHPQIYMCPRKELHHLAPELVMDRYRLTDSEYLALFAGAGDAVRIGEASVWYLYSQTAARNIAAFSPGSRIVVMLRNPVDMIYANHAELYYNGSEDIESFREALSAELERASGRRVPAGQDATVLPLLCYRRTGMYFEQLERYWDVFGRERVHVILFDDFQKDSRAAFEGVCRFLEVDSEVEIDFRVVNPNKVWRSRRIRNWYFEPPRLVRWLAAPLPGRVQRKFGHWYWQLAVKLSPRIKLDEDLRAELAAVFADDVRRLGDALGRDLSAWLVSGPVPRTERSAGG